MVKIWKNGSLMSRQEGAVDVLSYVINYCLSVFEGIRVYEPGIWLLDEHLNRLADSAKAYGMVVPYDLSELRQACLEVVAANPGVDYLRPLVYRDLNPSLGHAIGVNSAGVDISVVIAPVTMGQYNKKWRCNGGTAVFITDIVRPRKHYPGQVKGGPNYAVYSEPACRQATAVEATEGLLLGEDDDDQRYLVDGPGANLFIVEKGTVVTPDTDYWNVLGGKTRSFILNEVLPSRHIPYVQEHISIDRFRAADEAFFSGTAIEVDPITAEVRMINGERRLPVIGRGVCGEVTERIRTSVQLATSGQVERCRHLLTAVPHNVATSA